MTGAQSSKRRNFGGNNAGQKGMPFGKLNCTNVEEVIHSDKAVIGTLNIMTYPGTVLFDTGATTSFISKEFIDAYGLKCNELKRAITILSVGGTIYVTHRREQQVLTICGCEYHADLYVIPMRDIAVILGMDWLSNHGAQIKCGENTVSIRSLDGDRIVYQGDKHTKLEAEIELNSMKEVIIEDIPVVREFQVVFPPDTRNTTKQRDRIHN